MNRSNFVQTEGYPLTAERLQELQTSFAVLAALGGIAGNLTILSGCEQIGNIINDGVVFINGEPLEFRKAAVSANSTVIIIETLVNRAFENGRVKAVYTIRHATFGTSATSWPWTEFKRPIETKELQAILAAKEEKITVTALATRITELEKKNAVFKSGCGMVLWQKPANEIPEGWQEVVDWQARMPVGLKEGDPDFGSIGKYGGERVASLTIANLPAHDHGLKVAKLNNAAGSGSEGVIRGDTETEKTGLTGGGKAFSILNPYRVVIFIEYIG